MPIPDTDLQALQLGALLHDAGKLFQRAGLRPSRSYDGFSQGDYGAHGAHAKWTADFVERHVAPRWPVRPHDLFTHHMPVPPSRTGRLIALADRLAAGEREADDAPGARPAWESQLLSIFSRLGDPSVASARDGYHALAPLELDRRVIFPSSDRLSPDECRSGYLRLWQGFERDFSALDRLEYDRYLEAAYHLLQRYCWCVPSAAYHQTPDVSLFDHSRLTCAIATCLYLDDLSEERLAALLPGRPCPERGEPLMLLVGGDLSGLQEFLYTITSDGAAKTLRGRSFYLQLLADTAARFVMDRLGLALPNMIYWGGGHFYMLAPLSAMEKLEEAAAEVEERMLALHGGDLGLAIGHVALSAADFQGKSFAQKWGEVGIEIGRAKNRRFGRILGRSYHALFSPSGSGGSGARCQACHAEVPGRPQGGETRCAACDGMEELGNEVARASRAGGAVLSLGRQKPEGAGSWWQEALWKFGAWWEFGPGGDGALRYTLNDTNFVGTGADGFRWIPSVIPWEGRSGQQTIKSFNEMARDSVGIDRLGVLRMDVDDLGSLFAAGLGDAATASRVASLSSALRLFFEGWINRLCLEAEEEGEMMPPGAATRSGLLYGVYSGGDDLFIVGAWDRIPLLARRIREDLRAFAAGNQAVRISAGIALVDSHLPLYQSAGLAKEALDERAKKHRRGDGSRKDAVSLLGETMGWEELESVRLQVAELARLLGWGIERGQLPRSLLSLLSALHDTYRRETVGQAANEPGAPERLYYGRWMWMAAYGLGRARERAKDEEAKAALAALQKRLAEPAGIHRLGLTARWAELLTRSMEVDRR